MKLPVWVVVVVFSCIAFLLGMQQQKVMDLFQRESIKPSPMQETVEETVNSANSKAKVAPSVQPTVLEGEIAGKLCYPSDFLPPGKIIAKNTSSGMLYTQDYVGSSAGGGSAYTFTLPIGTYYLKYDAYPEAKNPNFVLSGFYTIYSRCVDSNQNEECSQQNRPLLTVTVEANSIVQNVNICDFYYSNPPLF